MQKEVLDYIKPLAVFPFVFLGIYLFENGFDLIAGVIGFVLICLVIAVYIVVRR